jgi:hypothetical protein
MKQRLFSVLLGIWCGFSVWAGTSPVYENYGVLTEPPEIDAITMINSGVMQFDYAGVFSYNGVLSSTIVSSLDTPVFSTQNTLNYTNTGSGSMYCTGGFELGLDTNGFKYLAQSFDNKGYISGTDLIIKATNLVNSGYVDAIYRGKIQIIGRDVNLRRGGLRADIGDTYFQTFTLYGTKTYYIGQGTNDVMLGDGAPLDLTQITMPYPYSPSHEVWYVNDSTLLGEQYFNTVYVPMLGSPSTFAAYAFTNQLNSTSIVVQVLFVNTNLTDTNMSMKAGFLSGRSKPQAVVQWCLPESDIFDGTKFTNYVTFVDNLPNVLSNYYYANYSNGEVQAPINYTLYQGRLAPILASMITTNAEFSDSLLVPEGMISTVVTNTYAAWYGAIGVDTVATASQVSIINPALFDPTNTSSRVEVEADNLDLSNTRIRAGSMIKVTTKNLVNNTGLQLDAPIMRWDVGATNGSLSISNLAPVKVGRIAGEIQAYSTVWTNTYDSVGADGTTNTMTVYGYAMYLDHTLFGNRQVQVYDATFTSTNVSIYDDLYITKNFNLKAESFYNAATLNGAAIAERNWSDFSQLKYFTNSGTIDTDVGRFVFNRATNPVSSFVNQGTITGAGIDINAKSFQNSGDLEANYGSVKLTAIQAKLDGGTITSVGDVSLGVNDLKVRQTSVSGSVLLFQVTNSLTDGGPVEVGSQNNWNCYGGFNLAVLPKESDLRGTRILSYGPQYTAVDHYWAGKNYGVSAAGYTNNAALGALILDGQQYSQFVFKGPGTNSYTTNSGVVTVIPANAIYVDYLDLRDYATNFTDSLSIADNMVIYFAAASVPVEQLDGALNGHLRWVRSYAGPASSTTFYLSNGQSILVNSGLLSSSTIDSDGDGIANALDATPFDLQLVAVKLADAGTNAISISWNAAAQTAYYLEFATNVTQTSWTLLKSVTNSLTTNTLTTVNVPKTSAGAERYYRVRYTP